MTIKIENGIVTMSEEEYDELLDDSLMLSALEINGVDNWYWYDEAIETYQELKGENE